MIVLQSFIDTPGIVAACGGQKGALSFAFSHGVAIDDRDRWSAVFPSLLSLLELIQEERQARVILGQHSVLICRNETAYIGVAIRKGHPVGKSLQRMIRRKFKYLNAPMSEFVSPRAPPISPPSPFSGFKTDGSSS